MQSYARIVIPLLLIGYFMIPACARKLGFEYSDGTQGAIEVVDLPNPKSPSRVFGLGEAMAAGKDVLLFRQVRKPSALKHMERNFFFISKLMESYEPTVKVIELPNSVSYPQGDYYADLMDNFPANGYGVVKKEGNGYRLYSSKFGYSEEYDTFVLPVKESIEQVLGPCPFDKKKLIKSTSCYEPFNKAIKEKRHLILYSFADACSSFSAQEGQRLVQTMQRDFSRDAEIIEVNYKNYTDPANELYAQVNNMVCVYNARLRKASPALFGGSDVAATIRRLLDER